jgi:hypothetical protein
VPVVAFVNNHFEGYAPQTVAQLLAALVQAGNPGVPAHGGQRMRDQPRQVGERLFTGGTARPLGAWTATLVQGGFGGAQGAPGGSNLLPGARASGRFGTFRQNAGKCENLGFSWVFLRFCGEGNNGQKL